MVTHLNVYYTFYCCNRPEQEQKLKAPKMQAAFRASCKQITTAASELPRCLLFTLLQQNHLVSCRDKLYPPCLLLQVTIKMQWPCKTHIFYNILPTGQIGKDLYRSSGAVWFKWQSKTFFLSFLSCNCSKLQSSICNMNITALCSCLFSYFSHAPNATQPRPLTELLSLIVVNTGQSSAEHSHLKVLSIWVVLLASSCYLTPLLSA